MKTQPIRTGLILMVILLGSSEITIGLALHLYHPSPGQENWELGSGEGGGVYLPEGKQAKMWSDTMFK